MVSFIYEIDSYLPRNNIEYNYDYVDKVEHINNSFVFFISFLHIFKFELEHDGVNVQMCASKLTLPLVLV